jgi:phosphatidyl-myo-inositol alpha-mannosyltransferase
VRVAIVSPYDLTVPGGVQSHVRLLAEALRERGDQVVLVGPGDGPDHLGVGASVAVPFNDSVAPIALAPTAWTRTRGLLARLRPDVVHVHEPLVPLVGVAAATTDVAPVVATFHAWSERARAYRAARPLGRALLHRAARLIAVSPAAASYHAEALGVEPSRFVQVPNGVDAGRFLDAEPREDLMDRDRTTLLFVGRLEPRKGLEPMIRAFVALCSQREDLRLLVVGDGPERARCEALVPERLRDTVTFLGRVDHDDLPGCFAAADVYVSPALGGESFGIVLLEAMAAGLPVIASDIPGYRTVLREGVQGRFAPPGDPARLAEVVAEVTDDAAGRQRMAAAGRDTVGEYDWPAVATRVREVYLDAITARD